MPVSVLNGPWLRRKSLQINVLHESSEIINNQSGHASLREAKEPIPQPFERG
jgi:hypothetical protein